MQRQKLCLKPANASQDEENFLEDWRRDRPLGILIEIINYIRIPKQHELFENFQRIANRELPTNEQKILQPVKPVATRWNSYYSAFERAVQLQAAVNAYAGHHIRLLRDEDTYAMSKGNSLPTAAPWMRSSGIGGRGQEELKD
jgi:hypothetical protein